MSPTTMSPKGYPTSAWQSKTPKHTIAHWSNQYKLVASKSKSHFSKSHEHRGSPRQKETKDSIKRRLLENSKKLPPPTQLHSTLVIMGLSCMVLLMSLGLLHLLLLYLIINASKVILYWRILVRWFIWIKSSAIRYDIFVAPFARPCIYHASGSLAIFWHKIKYCFLPQVK